MALHMDGKSSAPSRKVQTTVFLEVVPRGASDRDTGQGHIFLALCTTVPTSPPSPTWPAQTEFCYNQLHPSETAKTITILDVQGVGIRDLGTYFLVLIFERWREALK